MTERDCPGDATLRAFDAGDLAGADLERVAQHLEICPACERRLDARRTTDPVVDALRRPRPRPLTPPASGPSGAGGAANLPGYEILEELGRGGMGVVHKARDRRLNRLVALKRVRLGGQVERELFRREAEAVAQLQHPNIVQIFEIGEQDGEPYLALEYVPGGSLAQRLDGKPLPHRAAAELVETLARAVQHAHERGIVHRDLKPANILLLDDVPKIADFGVAKRLDVATTATGEGMTIGTPQYMAPEQAAGKSRSVGPAADTYALGAILYELLTGRPPFVGESSLETLRQVIEQEPLPPRRLRPRLPRDLETVCLKCLHKQPARRYASAAELADDLGRWRNGEPIRARPVGRGERLLRWCQRKPALASLAVALLLVTALGLAGVLWQWGQAVAARDIAESETAHADQERTKAERLAGDLRTQNEQILRQTYRANIAAAASALQLNSVTTARAHLAAASEKLRNWEWRHLGSQLDCARLVLPVHETSGQPLSPDGQHVAALGAPGTLGLWDAATGAALPIETGLPEGRWHVRFTPDGRRIVAFGQDGTLRVWDVRTGKVVRTLRAGAGVHYFILSPDNRHTAAIMDQGGLRAWDLTTGKETLHVPFKVEGGSTHLAYSPAGDRLVYAQANHTVHVVEAATGKEVAVLRGHTALVNLFAFSPDGMRLATCGLYPDTSLRLWRVATGEQLALLTDHKNQINFVEFSPDGTRLATGSSDQTARLWDGSTYQPLATLRGHIGGVSCGAINRAGTRLVTGGSDGSLRLWDAAGGEPVAVLRGHAQDVQSVAFSPGGDRLASGSTDGTVRLWDVELMERAGVLRGHTSYVVSVAFAPGGERLASVAWDGTARLWDAGTGRQVGLHRLGTAAPETLAFSPDGGRLAIGEGAAGTVRVWDLAADRQHLGLKVGGRGLCVAWAPRSATLAVSGVGCPLRLWDPQTGGLVGALGNHDGDSALAFSPNGAWLASAGGGRGVRLWDVQTRALLAVLGDAPALVARVAFSADGCLLAGVVHKQVYVWDVKAHELLAVLAHGSAVYGVAFSPDGTRLATGCRDNTVRLWDVATYEEVAELHGHKDYVHAVAFSPDGTRLASASGDFTVHVWDTLSAHDRAGRK